MNTYVHLSRILLRMGNVSDKVVGKVKTQVFCPRTFFSECRSVYEIMWKNIVEADRQQMTVWRMRIACWIAKARNTHSEYVILTAFPLQQWLYQITSMLRYTKVHGLTLVFF